MSRRRLFQASLGSLALAALAPAAARGQNGPRGLATSPKKILVLGAGMAGLTAALALYRRGHDVTVIEYQNRVGGRLFSIPLTNGQFSEAGGGHFRSNMPYVLNYIRQFELPLVTMNDGLPRYHIKGETAEAAYLDPWPWALTDEERGVSVTST